jgi:CRISPR/Cas system-associated protein Csx1
MISAGVNPIIKEMLIGHKSMLGLDNNYYKPTEQQVLQEYLKAVDFLIINDEHRLQKKISILEEKQDDLTTLKLAQKQKDKEVEEQMLHYEMRIDQLEEEKNRTNVELEQINQMVQSMFSQLKSEITPKLAKIKEKVDKKKNKKQNPP